MRSLADYLDQRLSQGQGYLIKTEAMTALGLSAKAFSEAARRLIDRHRLARLKRGFYLILRPEDVVMGAPDPARWIDPLMNHLKLDYRISLLRAAAFHGASHQAAMVFQVITPKQMPPIEIGRQRVQFVFQTAHSFATTNRPEWLNQIKSDAGFAKVAGVELTLLDCARYLHKSAGLNGAAQIAHDLGAKANPRKLAKAASFYENSAVRRLGYLLEHFRHKRQAKALLPFADKAKSMKLLDPSVRPLRAALDRHGAAGERDPKWKLGINELVEIDS